MLELMLPCIRMLYMLHPAPACPLQCHGCLMCPGTQERVVLWLLYQGQLTAMYIDKTWAPAQLARCTLHSVTETGQHV